LIFWFFLVKQKERKYPIKKYLIDFIYKQTCGCLIVRSFVLIQKNQKIKNAGSPPGGIQPLAPGCLSCRTTIAHINRIGRCRPGGERPNKTSGAIGFVLTFWSSKKKVKKVSTLPGRDLQSHPLNEGFLILLTPGFSQVDILADCFVGAIHESPLLESPLQVCVRNLKLIGKRSLLFNLWN